MPNSLGLLLSLGLVVAVVGSLAVLADSVWQRRADHGPFVLRGSSNEERSPLSREHIRLVSALDDEPSVVYGQLRQIAERHALVLRDPLENVLAATRPDVEGLLAQIEAGLEMRSPCSESSTGEEGP